MRQDERSVRRFAARASAGLALMLAAALAGASTAAAQEPERPPPEPEAEQPRQEAEQPRQEAEQPGSPVIEVAEQEPRQPGSGQHRVRRGDTLWDLAKRYLSDPFEWPRIHEANRDLVANPHLIFPDQVLSIPGRGRVTGVAVVRAEQPPARTVGGTEEGAGPSLDRSSSREIDRTIFFPRPESERWPSFVEPEPVEPVGVTAAVQLAAPWLADPATLPVVARVTRVAQELTSMPAVRHTIRPFDRILLHANGQQPAIGDRLLLVRPDRPLVLGRRLIVPTAVVRVEALEDGGVIATVVEQFERATVDDLALPYYPVESVAPPERTVTEGPKGELVGFASPRNIHQITDYGFVDLGLAHGVELGDDLMAFLPARQIRGRWIPPEWIALLRVVRVGEEVSTVRVIRMDQPAVEPGVSVQLVRKVR